MKSDLLSRAQALGPWRYEHRSGQLVIHGDADIASIEAEHDSRRELAAVLRAVLGGRNPAALSVLDLGCLEGHYTAVIARLGFQRVVGIDISEPHLERARFLLREFHGLTNAEVHKCAATDSEALKSLGRFDIVVCHGLLYHLKDPLLLFDVLEQIAPSGRRFDLLLSTQFKGGFGHLISRTPVAELQVKAGFSQPAAVDGKYIYSAADQSVFERLSLRLNPAAVYATLRQYGYEQIASLDTPRGARYGYTMNLVCRKGAGDSLDHEELRKVGVTARRWEGRSVDGFDFQRNPLVRAAAAAMFYWSKLLYRLTAGRHIRSRRR